MGPPGRDDPSQVGNDYAATEDNRFALCLILTCYTIATIRSCSSTSNRPISTVVLTSIRHHEVEASWEPHSEPIIAGRI